MGIIPFGYCRCGCGNKTKISLYNNKTRGYKKGDPKRFINFHQNRSTHNPMWNNGKTITVYGYIKIKTPKHPRADSKGYVMEQVLIAERVLGKSLSNDTIVHHINAKHGDNQNKNLVICQNVDYHNLLHKRTRALKACGNANYEICNICKNYDSPQNLIHRKRSNQFHSSCMSRYNKNRKGGITMGKKKKPKPC